MLYVKCYTGLSCPQNVQLFLSKEEPLSSLGYFRNMTQMLYWESRQQKKKKKKNGCEHFSKHFFSLVEDFVFTHFEFVKDLISFRF